MIDRKKPQNTSSDTTEFVNENVIDRDQDRGEDQGGRVGLGEPDDELVDEMDSEFLNDIEEAAEAELASMLEETGGHVKQRASSLLIKLELYPDGAFPISQYSTFDQDEWTLFKNKYGSAKRIYFADLEKPKKELKKSLTYYAVPDFSPFGTIRSYKTTIGRAGYFAILDRYLLTPNFLDGSPESIALINHRMINKALELAKSNVAVSRHYHSLYEIIRLWCSLSIQGLMPIGLALSIDIRKVDSNERRKDVIRHFTGNMSPWKPYSEEDLEELIDYALFWTEKALPKLLGVVEYLTKHQLASEKNCLIQKNYIDDVLEKNLNIELDDKVIISAPRTTRNRNTGRFQYVWLNSYCYSLDKVRNAIFILVALITGLRASELSFLKFDDIIKDGNDEYTIRVVRYKTADDPNVEGEVDYLPLPRFIGEKIQELEKLRSIYTLYAEGYIFQSSKSRKALNKPSTNIVRLICDEIGEATNIDRIHSHRFRKTIAEILINRNERNIDLIRHLFGHRSFTMTLQYIGRNPRLVRSVALAVEQNYTAEFTDLVSAVKSGASSGPSAERLLDRIKARPDAFSGKQLKVTIFVYISHLLSSGEPLFIHRTAIGSYCVSTETYSSPNLPPCLEHMTGIVTNMLPNPTRCDISCTHAVVVEKAKHAIQDNVKFYSNMLEKAEDTLSEQAMKMIRKKIASNIEHLHNLETNKLGIIHQQIPVKQVTV